MRYKLLFLFLVSFVSLLHSQTEKKLNATVFSNGFVLKGVEVGNLQSKKTTTTNDIGVFSIMAKSGDQLIFISKNYEYKTITLKEEDFQNSHFRITLVKKPEELDEVVVTNLNPIKWTIDKKYEQGKRDELKLEKAARNPKANVYDGTIENGMDFVRIGKMVKGFFIKEKGKTEEIPEVKFKELVSSKLNQDFFTNTLALKPEEVALFLEYCEADPKSKNLMKDSNELELMDFLFNKNIEFKKL